MNEILQIGERRFPELGYFDYVTLSSFLYFQMNNVDIAVMECGIGGRLDSTNVINPEVSVITSIGMDHTELLGDSLYKIATEKAGIIKQGVPCIISPLCEPEEVFKDKCLLMNSLFHSYTLNENMVKNYDLLNQATAQCAIEILQKERGLRITKEAINIGISKMPSCRMEQIPIPLIPKSSKSNLMYLDVAHNEEGLEATLRSLMFKHPEKKVEVVYAVASTKDIYSCIEVLFEYCSKVSFTTSFHPKLAKIEQIKESVSNFTSENNLNGFEINFFENLNEAINSTIEKSTNESLVLITGSFFIMSETRKYFGFNDKVDPIEVNQNFIVDNNLVNNHAKLRTIA